MATWHEHEGGLDSECLFDPLCIERSAPIDDDEAELIETLCLASTPGPLVIDDDASGEGAVVATLPDGRTIVSLTAGVEHTESDGALDANAQLICKARFLLLRLLRDRQQWKEEKDFLTQRIRTLEVLLEGESEKAQGVKRSPAPLPR